jgi:hypothetical protein
LPVWRARIFSVMFMPIGGIPFHASE